MSKTKISWCTDVWNPIVGCTKVSSGCDSCYAISMAHRLASNPKTPQYAGTTKITNGRPNWSGKLNLVEHKLREPLRWRKPALVFVNSMSDLFHESVPDEWIDRVFAVMALCPQHTFQVLTKRPERMARYQTYNAAMRILGAMEYVTGSKQFEATVSLPLPNVWLGVSVENQNAWNERVLDLSRTAAAVRFVSVEPMLGPIDMGETYGLYQLDDNTYALKVGARWDRSPDWIICGGESGPRARPMNPNWARSIRDQCAGADVPFMFKQHGAWVDEFHPKAHPQTMSTDDSFVTYVDRDGNECGAVGADDYKGLYMVRVGKNKAGRELDGVVHDDYPRART